MTDLEWDKLHYQARLLLCGYAGVQEHIAERAWVDVEPWLQETLDSALQVRSNNKVYLASKGRKHDTV